MELAELQAKAATHFPPAVKFAIANPGSDNPSFDELQRLCGENYSRLGFRCHADCFEAIAPKRDGMLTLDAWCKAELQISGWLVKVTMRPFYFGAGYVHFSIRHNGAIPGLTGTGYRSHFTPLATFAELTPEDFLTVLIPPSPRKQQLMLF